MLADKQQKNYRYSIENILVFKYNSNCDKNADFVQHPKI